MKDLTKKQKKVLDTIKSFISEEGFPPTCQELRTILGFASANSITGYLDAIEKKGFIKRKPRLSRSIVVL